MVLTGAVCGCAMIRVMLLNPRRLTLCLILHRYVPCPFSNDSFVFISDYMLWYIVNAGYIDPN